VFSTLDIIPSEFWNICGTLYILHCTCYSSIQSWNITISGLTISGLEKRTSAILKFYFRFWLRHYHTVLDMSFCIRLSNFIRIGQFWMIMMFYRFSRWRTLWRNFTSGFGLAESISSEGQCLSAKKNCSYGTIRTWVITIFGLAKQPIAVGILLPDSISIISAQSAYLSAPVYQISSKSDDRKMAIFKMADLRHLEF